MSAARDAMTAHQSISRSLKEVTLTVNHVHVMQRARLCREENEGSFVVPETSYTHFLEAMLVLVASGRDDEVRAKVKQLVVPRRIDGTTDTVNETATTLISLLAAYCSFAESKAVFTFEPEILRAVSSSSMENAPASVFRRLPYGGQWIDLADLCLEHPEGGQIQGVFAFLMSDIPHDQSGEERPVYVETLQLVLVPKQGDIYYSTAVVDLDTPLKETFEEDPSFVPVAGAILPLIAYICSESPDIRIVKTGKKRKKKRKNQTITHKPVVHECGFVLVKQLHAARAQAEGGGGGTKRPHMRRGHWHTYWRGPRKGKRVQTIKWVLPTMIAGSRKDLPVTNRKVTSKTRKKHDQ